MAASHCATRLLTFIAGLALLSACGNDGSEVLEPRIRPVRTAVALSAPPTLKSRYAGNSQAASTSNVSFRVPGIIIKLPAQVGKMLKKGDLIARLDSNDYRITLEQNQAALAQVMVSAQNAKSRYERIKKLFARNVISEIDFENSEAEYRTGIAEVQQSKRSVELSHEQLSYTELNSPADGCSITEAISTENENIAAGQTIAILSCGAIMEVMAAVPESVVGRVRLGQEVGVIFNSLGDEVFDAEVTEIGVSSSTNGVYLVTARLTHSDPRLRPGMASELVLSRQLDVNSKHVWLPLVAVGEENGQRFVMVYQPRDENQGTVKKVIVEVGRFVMGALEVTQGLQPGQRVITAGLSQIQDGLTVKRLSSELSAEASSEVSSTTSSTTTPTR